MVVNIADYYYLLMNRFLSSAAIIAAGALALAFGSCKNESSLARQIEGTWQGNPTTINGGAPGIITMTDTWTFVRDDPSATGGTLVLTSLASVEWPLNALQADTITSPSAGSYAVSMSAAVSLNATWDLDVHDPDDEVLISIDPRSLAVNIDPDAVTVSSNSDATILDSIPPTIYASAKAELTRAIGQRFFPINRLEDVKATARGLSFDIPPTTEDGAEIKVTLRRQGDIARANDSRQ